MHHKITSFLRNHQSRRIARDNPRQRDISKRHATASKNAANFSET